MLNITWKTIENKKARLCYKAQPFVQNEIMKEKIKAFAAQLHIEYLGIVSAEPMCELKEKLLLSREKYGMIPFEEKDIDKRCNPLLTMENAKSIIVCLFPYTNNMDDVQNISAYARIPDYHKVAGAYLSQICSFIRDAEPDCNLIPFVDNGPLADKYLAYLAGLGFQGKHTLLINEKYGSFCFIGYIITDLSMEADKPMDQTCVNCRACIEACPGKALESDGMIDARKCISFITQTKEITKEQKEILSSQPYVYGCDICQQVCPHNRDLPCIPIPEFSQPTLKQLDKAELEMMSGREFKRKYANFSFAWRGKDAILKNFGK